MKCEFCNRSLEDGEMFETEDGVMCRACWDSENPSDVDGRELAAALVEELAAADSPAEAERVLMALLEEIGADVRVDTLDSRRVLTCDRGVVVGGAILTVQVRPDWR